MLEIFVEIDKLYQAYKRELCIMLYEIFCNSNNTTRGVQKVLSLTMMGNNVILFPLEDFYFLVIQHFFSHLSLYIIQNNNHN